MSFNRTMILAGGSLTTCLLGYFSMWTHKQSTQISEDLRGSLIHRMKEVASTLFSKKQIKDTYTAENHAVTVASLSTKTITSNEIRKTEINKAKKSYGCGYLSEIFLNLPSHAVPVFEFNKNIYFALLSASIEKGVFVHFGELNHLNDCEARESILKGDYIRCKSLIPTKMATEEETFQENNNYSDVIITKSKGCDNCTELFKEILSNEAMNAGNKLPQNPSFSQIPVFDCKKEICASVGNLTEMPEAIRSKLRNNNFTACHFPHESRACLRSEIFKEGGAILAGIIDDTICQDIYS